MLRLLTPSSETDAPREYTVNVKQGGKRGMGNRKMAGPRLLFCSILLLLLSGEIESARILALFPFPARSHFNCFASLLETLARRGHEMTVVSSFPRSSPIPNYRDIATENHFENQNDVNFFETTNASAFIVMAMTSKMVFIPCCEKFVAQPQVQEIIHSNETYDLILTEAFFSECTYGFVHKFKAPFIQLSSNTISIWMGDGVGNPNIFSYIPDIIMPYTDEMTFLERFHNTIFQTFMYLLRAWYIIPSMDSIMRNNFPDPAIPSIPDIEKNAAFLLLNSYVPITQPRPLTPNTAEVGGMHIKEPKKLPADLQKYLDDAPHGVIYFSMGSHLKSTMMPEGKRNQILNALSQLKQKVLWKWEMDSLPGQPKNVRTSKWLPQNDILAHPNVKLFITHGGLLSIQETIYHAKPLVAIPVLADQTINARKAQKAGYGVPVHFDNLTTESLSWAIHEVLNNPSYTENAERISRIFKDRPQKPLDQAVFSVEYVLRHKGAAHMRSAGLQLNFFQYYVLDVIAIVLGVVLAAITIIVLSCKALYRRIFSKSAKPKSVSKSKKNK